MLIAIAIAEKIQGSKRIALVPEPSTLLSRQETSRSTKRPSRCWLNLWSVKPQILLSAIYLNWCQDCWRCIKFCSVFTVHLSRIPKRIKLVCCRLLTTWRGAWGRLQHFASSRYTSWWWIYLKILCWQYFLRWGRKPLKGSFTIFLFSVRTRILDRWGVV